MFQIFQKLFQPKDQTFLKEALKNDAFLMDVRSQSEFKSGSIPGGINIPLGEIQQHLSVLKNKKQLVVFCRSGNRSKLAQLTLQKHGLKNVVDGGSLYNLQQ